MSYELRAAKQAWSGLTILSTGGIGGRVNLRIPRLKEEIMATSEQIVAALQGMDPTNDEQWTTNGLARMDHVEAALGEDVDRKDLNGAWTGFNRAVLTAWKAEQAESGEPALKPGALEAEQEPALKPGALEAEQEPALKPGALKEPNDVFLPDEWGGALVNGNAGPASARACQNGFEPEEYDYYNQCYAVWTEQRLYIVERTTTGVSPAFPAD